jgi:hypothetical protein
MDDMTLQNNQKDPLNPAKTSLDEEGKANLSESDLDKIAGGDADTTYYQANCSYCGWYWPPDTYEHTFAQVAAHNTPGSKHNAVISDNNPIQN